ncbi:MAG: hypothetical protein AAF378_13140 [Cyanobacteria bacterium P01_A01_bin.84]
MSTHLEIRLKDLEDHIQQDFDLLKKYEDTLRYEDDPRRKIKYQKEIEKLKESANGYQQELDELTKQLSNDITIHKPTFLEQLQQMNIKLDILKNVQFDIHQDLDSLHQSLLVRYEKTEQKIIEAFIQKLNHSQLTTVQKIICAIDDNRLPEAQMLQIIENTEYAIAKLQQSGISLPSNQEQVTEIIKSPGLDTKHRLKISLPIIPILLSYEGELELGSGIDLKAVWQKLLTRFQGE